MVYCHEIASVAVLAVLSSVPVEAEGFCIWEPDGSVRPYVHPLVWENDPTLNQFDLLERRDDLEG